MEQLKNTMNKKLKSMEQQLEEEHEQKQLAIKVRLMYTHIRVLKHEPNWLNNG